MMTNLTEPALGSGPARQPALCVRCGKRPRAGETFLCPPCLDDPQARAEAAECLRAQGGYIDQRRVAIKKFHWFGGWGRP